MYNGNLHCSHKMSPKVVIYGKKGDGSDIFGIRNTAKQNLVKYCERISHIMVPI